MKFLKEFSFIKNIREFIGFKKSVFYLLLYVVILIFIIVLNSTSSRVVMAMFLIVSGLNFISSTKRFQEKFKDKKFKDLSIKLKIFFSLITIVVYIVVINSNIYSHNSPLITYSIIMWIAFILRYTEGIMRTIVALIGFSVTLIYLTVRVVNDLDGGGSIIVIIALAIGYLFIRRKEELNNKNKDEDRKWRVLRRILIIGFMILVIIPNGIIIVSNIAYKQSESKSPLKLPYSNSVQAALNLYVNMPKISPFEDSAYYLMAKNKYDSKNQYFAIDAYGNYGYYKDDLDKFNIDEAIKYHKKALEKGEESDQYYENLYSLINLYYLKGEMNSAFKLIDNCKNNKMKDLVFLAEGIMNLKIQEYDKAIQSFNKVNGEKYIRDAYLLKGDYKKFIEYSDAPYRVIRNDKDGFDYLKIENILKEIDYINVDNIVSELENSSEDSNGIVFKKYNSNLISDEFRGNLKGKFTFNNIPMNGSLMILSKDAYKTSLLGARKTFEDIQSFCYLKDDGSFEFNNIPEGLYELSILIPRQKAIELRGEDLSQKFFVSKYISIERNKDNNLNIDERDFNNKNFKFYSMEANKEKIILKSDSNGNFENPLEIFKQDSKSEINFYKIFVKQGANSLENEYYLRRVNSDVKNNYFIGESEVNAKSLEINYPSEVLKSMKEDRYDKVLSYYEEEYKKDKNNEFTLQMLIKLYTTGVNELGDKKDVNKAIKLSDELYKINNDDSLDKQVKKFILDNYRVFYLTY
ncbi:tetratricopeptide repeat protein [Clostridium mediterraneense]|uniref:tetratricopeptide repeat protein n=1 Tax=Clostridium mediterraneense TaxID=1805472 RepID=UPI00082D0A14|nr:hypothetical protein [Clostridium mediterraneense]